MKIYLFNSRVLRSVNARVLVRNFLIHVLGMHMERNLTFNFAKKCMLLLFLCFVLEKF